MAWLENPLIVSLVSIAATGLAAVLVTFVSKFIDSWRKGMSPARRRAVIRAAESVHDFLEGVKELRPGGIEDIGVAFLDVFTDHFLELFGVRPTDVELEVAVDAATKRHARVGGSLRLKGPGMDL